LRARGLDGVKLAVSDDHLGLKAAIAKVIGCPWQRCTGWIQLVVATPDRGGCDGKVEAPGIEAGKGSGDALAGSSAGRAS
jgi:hypothetical protein